ncbi:MAG: hypothetical protein NC548_54105 [Lachnospiraceae bacterium]|nr:hypothetical protein [Lachnospiraceae bacterium]
MELSELIKGRIIAFEGADCCFKETNQKTFVKRLKEKLGKDNSSIIASKSFPQYESKSSYFVQNWLDGTYDRTDLKHNHRLVDTMYALDRYDYWNFRLYNNPSMLDHLHMKKYCFVFDRYCVSNAFYNPLYGGLPTKDDFEFDFDLCGNPKPDIVVLMYSSDPDVSIKLLEEKKNKDKNELDIEFIRSVHENIHHAIDQKLFAKANIRCIPVNILDKDGNIRNKKDIADEVYMRTIAALYDLK